LVRHRELVEVRHSPLHEEDGRRPVGLGEIDLERLLPLEIVLVEPAPEALLEEVPKPVLVERAPALVTQDLLTAPDEGAVSAVREELLREVFGGGDRNRGRGGKLGE